MRTLRPVSNFAPAALIAIALLGVGIPVGAASKLTAGSVEFWVTPTNNGTARIIIAGAIGDYGTVSNQDKNGKSNPNGNYVMLTLQRGTIELNATAFQTLSSKSSFPINHESCSSHGSFTATETIVNGTGLYKKISGSVSVTQSNVWILKSPCPTGNSVLTSSQYLTGTGTVSF